MIIEKEPISSRPFAGLGVQADCYIYNGINRQCGVSDDDYALWERRLKALRPGFARIFVPTTEFNPSGDGFTYDWETREMQWQCRNLAVLRESGAKINLCMGPWTNNVMCQPGSERLAVDLVKHLVKERGFDHIRWLTLFNEPDTIYAPDTPLEKSLRTQGYGGEGRPWADYVDKHRRALELLDQCGLGERIRLVVADTVWPPDRRLERLSVSARSFAGMEVGYGFHYYVPDAPEFFDHPEPAPWRPPPLVEEVQGYRRAVGPEAELVVWEYNEPAFGQFNFWLGTGSRGEDHWGTFECAVTSAGKILKMLANGADGLSIWCLGDMFYPEGFVCGVMYTGLWRYKWEGWVPRPNYFYYAALIEAFRPGMLLHAVNELPSGLLGLAAVGAEGSVVAVLNQTAMPVELPVSWSEAGSRLRVSSKHLPRQPDSPLRNTPEAGLPLHRWESLTGEPGRCQMEPGELTIFRSHGPQLAQGSF